HGHWLTTGHTPCVRGQSERRGRVGQAGRRPVRRRRGSAVRGRRWPGPNPAHHRFPDLRRGVHRPVGAEVVPVHAVRGRRRPDLDLVASLRDSHPATGWSLLMAGAAQESDRRTEKPARKWRYRRIIGLYFISFGCAGNSWRPLTNGVLLRSVG